MAVLENTSSYAGPFAVSVDADPEVHDIIERVTPMPTRRFSNLKELLKVASKFEPVVVFIDIRTEPEHSDIDFVMDVRRIWPYVPIIVMSTSTDEVIGEALAVGANDYICKPLDPYEVKARMQARMTEMEVRQATDERPFGDIRFNPKSRVLRRLHQRIEIPRLEAEILICLIESEGLPVSKEHLRVRLWGTTRTCDNALDKKLSNLRRALTRLNASMRLKTIYGGNIGVEFFPPRASRKTKRNSPST